MLSHEWLVRTHDHGTERVASQGNKYFKLNGINLLIYEKGFPTYFHQSNILLHYVRNDRALIPLYLIISKLSIKIFGVCLSTSGQSGHRTEKVGSQGNKNLQNGKFEQVF